MLLLLGGVILRVLESNQLRSKNWLHRSVVLLVTLLVLLSVATPAYAIEDPDSISIESVKVYEGLWESGDMLFLVEYKIMYGSNPDEDPQDTFLLGVWAGAVKGPDRPLDYYYHNFTSVYLTAAQVATFGYTFEDELKVRVAGNPAYFPVLTEGVNMDTATLSAGNWVNGGDLETTRTYLAAWCIILAKVFEASWDITLLTSGDKLNSTGMLKFKEAIPGLDSICPEIFQVYATFPEYDDPAYTPTYEVTLLGRMGPRLEVALNGLGQWLTGKPDMGGLVGGVGLAILFFVLAGRIFVATGSVPTSVVVSIPFLFVGNLIGVLSLTITFVAAFLVLVTFAITFILGRM